MNNEPMLSAEEIDNRVQCSRCNERMDVGETFDFGQRLVCVDCAQDEIHELFGAVETRRP